MNHNLLTDRQTIILLDYARTFFTCIVVLAHANLIVDSSLFHGFFVEGWSGVDFFFILSGFLFYYNYNTKENAPRYCKKRFVRIFPSYWIYTFGTLIVYCIYGYLSHNQAFDFDFKNIIYSFLCIPTDIANHVNPIIPTAWTLPYELTFYIFGLILIVSKKYKIFHVTCIIWFVIIVAFLIIRPLAVPFCFSDLFIEFLLGIIIATIFKKYKVCEKGKCLFVVGILFAFTSWIMTNIGVLGRNVRVLSFGVPYAIIVLGLAYMSGEKKDQNRFILFFSRASYSIYLTHYQILGIICSAGRKVGLVNNSILLMAVSVVISIFVGCVCYMFIEKPVNYRARKVLRLS